MPSSLVQCLEIHDEGVRGKTPLTESGDRCLRSNNCCGTALQRCVSQRCSLGPAHKARLNDDCIAEVEAKLPTKDKTCAPCVLTAMRRCEKRRKLELQAEIYMAECHDLVMKCIERKSS